MELPQKLETEEFKKDFGRIIKKFDFDVLSDLYSPFTEQNPFRELFESSKFPNNLKFLGRKAFKNLDVFSKFIRTQVDPKRDGTHDSNKRYAIREAGKVINWLTNNQFPHLYKQDKNGSLLSGFRPMRDLFLWAVIMLKFDIAKAIWGRNDDGSQMASALTASHLLKSMANEIKNCSDESLSILNGLFISDAEWFEKQAKEILIECSKRNFSQTVALFLSASSDWGDKSLCTLALDGKHLKFLDQDCCRYALMLTWTSPINSVRAKFEEILFTDWWEKMYSSWYEETDDKLTNKDTTSETFELNKDEKEHVDQVGSELNIQNMEHTAMDILSNNNGSDQSEMHAEMMQIPSTEKFDDHIASTSNITQMNGEIAVLSTNNGSDQSEMHVEIIHIPSTEESDDQIASTSNITKMNEEMVALTIEDESYQEKRCGDSCYECRYVCEYISLCVFCGCFYLIYLAVINLRDLCHSDPCDQCEQCDCPSFIPKSPRFKFSIYLLSHISFLCIFSYFLLFNIAPGNPSIYEYLVWCWIFSMWLEELRQLLDTSGPNIARKCQSYLSVSWNAYDQIGFIPFYVAIPMRFIISENNFYWIVMVYTVGLIIHILSLLHYLVVLEYFGPKIGILVRMFKNTIAYLFLFALFLIAYGIAAQALWYPNSTPSWDVPLNIVEVPYFTIFGQFELPQAQMSHCTYNDSHVSMEDEIPKCSWLVGFQIIIIK